jgi:hypothetical protein
MRYINIVDAIVIGTICLFGYVLIKTLFDKRG